MAQPGSFHISSSLLAYAKTPLDVEHVINNHPLNNSAIHKLSPQKIESITPKRVPIPAPLPTRRQETQLQQLFATKNIALAPDLTPQTASRLTAVLRQDAHKASLQALSQKSLTTFGVTMHDVPADSVMISKRNDALNVYVSPQLLQLGFPQQSEHMKSILNDALKFR